MSTAPTTTSPSPTGLRPSAAQDAALVVVLAGVVAALGLVPAVPLPSGVPLTAQTLGVMLAGALLGARRGFLCLLLFTAVVAAGLPLLTGGRGGLEVFGSPAGGFVVGFPVAALVIGVLTERFTGPGRYRWGAGLVAVVIGGVLVQDVFGALGATWVSGASPVALLALVPADLLKAVLAASTAWWVHAARPGLLTSSPRA